MRDDASWSELKARIERIVPLEPQPLELGQRQFTWYRVANPESLLEAAVSDASRPAEEIDPFWAATWRAAIGLDRFLGSLVMADQRVLELGCGSGQAGTGAAARGAWVTMSDAVGLALQVAQLNAWPVKERIRFCQLRWDIDRLDEAPFPLVIGSDLVYDPQLFPRLSALRDDSTWRRAAGWS